MTSRRIVKIFNTLLDILIELLLKSDDSGICILPDSSGQGMPDTIQQVSDKAFKMYIGTKDFFFPLTLFSCS